MSTNLKDSIDALRAAKDESGLEAKATDVEAAVKSGLHSQITGKLETIANIRVMIDEALFHFLKMSNGKPFPGWKPWLTSVMKAETADWTDRALRNSWSVTLVDLGMSQAEAGNALNVSEATVQRACKDAELEAQGIDPEELRKQKRQERRKSDGSKSDAEKLLEAMKKAMPAMSDRTNWTDANLTDALAIGEDFVAAVRSTRERRNRPATVNAGVSGRTGQTTPSVADAADKAGVPVTPATPQRKSA